MECALAILCECFCIVSDCIRSGDETRRKNNTRWHIPNAVLPGMIRTDRWEKNPDFYVKVPSRYTPLGDVADGSDVADAVWYFAAHARNTTGAELVVDGGNTIQLYPIIPEA